MDSGKFSAPSVFARVTLAALAGLALGALFGWVSAKVAPGLFTGLVPWQTLEPAGAAVVLGAFGGTLCGGALGVFAQGVELLASWWSPTTPPRVGSPASQPPHNAGN